MKCGPSLTRFLSGKKKVKNHGKLIKKREGNQGTALRSALNASGTKVLEEGTEKKKADYLLSATSGHHAENALEAARTAHQ